MPAALARALCLWHVPVPRCAPGSLPSDHTAERGGREQVLDDGVRAHRHGGGRVER
eukprot:CAMPEP_0185208724 /NCGR_PEP_ID=MMETSP1140-20130426/62503_1 /TAXON_ID=298111 /ORGANISM="Pavlova sp., Strain CCMP459" /LENGTH=55 /DNA_ID=CAMNT_0027776457 /DNA_START=1 /DNA_END=164 /DNA_ORIENTATION=+